MSDTKTEAPENGADLAEKIDESKAIIAEAKKDSADQPTRASFFGEARELHLLRNLLDDHIARVVTGIAREPVVDGRGREIGSKASGKVLAALDEIDWMRDLGRALDAALERLPQPKGKPPGLERPVQPARVSVPAPR